MKSDETLFSLSLNFGGGIGVVREKNKNICTEGNCYEKLIKQVER